MKSSARAKKLILYFADGFSWQYLAERPFMNGFWDDQQPLETLLGYSSTVIPSILTGKWPRETGYWTEYYYEPREPSWLQRLLCRPALSPLLPFVNAMRLVYFRFARKLGSSAEHRLRLPLQISHLFSRHPLQYDQFPPIGFDVPTLADLFRERGLKVDFRYMKDVSREAELSRLTERASEVDVFFYYDPALDSAGHHVGASASALAPQMDAIDSFLQKACDILGASYDADFLLFSDHGMTTITGTFDLFAVLKDFRLGTDYVVFMDSTFARFWFPNPAMRQPILTRLASVPGTLLTSDDKRAYGIDFADDRYGEEVLVAEEGTVFHPNFFPGPLSPLARRYPERAMHGYRPECPSSRGIVCYRGSRWPGELPSPFSATDVFGVVDRITRGETTG
jgi:hypothetical protein